MPSSRVIEGQRPTAFQLRGTTDSYVIPVYLCFKGVNARLHTTIIYFPPCINRPACQHVQTCQRRETLIFRSLNWTTHSNCLFWTCI